MTVNVQPLITSHQTAYGLICRLKPEVSSEPYDSLLSLITGSVSSPEEYIRWIILPDCATIRLSIQYLCHPLPILTALVVAASWMTVVTFAITSSLVFAKRTLSENPLPKLVTIAKIIAISKSVIIISISVNAFLISGKYNEVLSACLYSS